MNVTAVRIFPFETREAGGRVVAYAEVEIDGALLVRGLRVMESSARGLFVGYPAQRARRGSEKLVELIVPITREARRAVRDAVTAEYKRVTGWEPAGKGGTGAGGGAEGGAGGAAPPP